jgi:colanic acid/amylovoran biosynthesis protein
MNKKIISVLHGTNYWNMGDLGLMEALLTSLKREFGDARVYIISPFANIKHPMGQKFDLGKYNATEIEGPTIFLPKSGFLKKLLFFLTRVLTILAYLAAKRSLNIRLSWLVPRQTEEMLSTLLKSDLIISKPGGFLYDVKEGRMPSVHHLFSILLATLTGKPVVLYAQSIGPFDRPFYYPFIRFILNRTRLILVRDQPSYDICKSVLRLKGPELKLTADEAFLLPDGDAALGRSLLRDCGIPLDANLVGMTILDWHFPNAADRSMAVDQYVSALTKLINHINQLYNAHVVIFPFFLGDGYTRTGDEEITTRLLQSGERGDMAHLFKGTEPATIKSAMQLMDVFVGSRMHSNIFALTSGVPVIAISYLPKTSGIMEMMGLSEFVLGIEGLNPIELKALFDRLWTERDHLRKALPARLEAIRAKARDNAFYCKQLLEKNRPDRPDRC